MIINLDCFEVHEDDFVWHALLIEKKKESEFQIMNHYWPQ